VIFDDGGAENGGRVEDGEDDEMQATIPIVNAVDPTAQCLHELERIVNADGSDLELLRRRVPGVRLDHVVPDGVEDQEACHGVDVIPMGENPRVQRVLGCIGVLKVIHGREPANPVLDETLILSNFIGADDIFGRAESRRQAAGELRLHLHVEQGRRCLCPSLLQCQ